MTTKSTVVNMLVAERVREIQGLREESDETAEDTEEEGAATDPDGGGDTDPEESEVGEEEELPPVFEEQSGQWYRPNTQEGHKFAVRMHDGSSTKYYKTVKGAAKRLRGEYGDG